jgi:hypothetical protein
MDIYRLVCSVIKRETTTSDIYGIMHNRVISYTDHFTRIMTFYLLFGRGHKTKRSDTHTGPHGPFTYANIYDPVTTI